MLVSTIDYLIRIEDTGSIVKKAFFCKQAEMLRF